MDEPLRISLGMVSGGGLGLVLGGGFGGLTGALYAQSGGAAGTRLGRRVADAFERAAESELPPVRRGVITGSADGAVFLGVVGTLVGALVAWVGGTDPRWLGVAALGSALLVGAAAFFGVLAYSMTRYGARAITCILGGGLLGSLLAGLWLGVDDCLFGTLLGFAAGLGLSILTDVLSPKPPRRREKGEWPA